MEHLHDRRVRQHRAQRFHLALQRDRVDQVEVVAAQPDLDQAQARVVGPLPDELGVECDRVLLADAVAEVGERVSRVDPREPAHWADRLMVHPNAWVRWTSMGRPATLWSMAWARYGVRTRSAEAGLSSTVPS